MFVAPAWPLLAGSADDLFASQTIWTIILKTKGACYPDG